jgi:hypothetical protein
MRLRSAIRSVGVLAAAAWLGACSAPPRSDAPTAAANVESPAHANQGRAWEVVLPGGGTTLAQGPETSRLDPRFARGQGSMIEESYWPDPRGLRLDWLRRTYLSDNPRQIHFFSARPVWPSRAYPVPYRGW